MGAMILFGCLDRSRRFEAQKIDVIIHHPPIDSCWGNIDVWNDFCCKFESPQIDLLDVDITVDVDIFTCFM
jgi:hypothetical protein